MYPINNFQKKAPEQGAFPFSTVLLLSFFGFDDRSA